MSKTYKTAEACRVLDVQPYVLRYWETEFSALGGKKPGPQRVYSGAELRVLQRIKELLYDEGYTIAGAKKRLDSETAEGEAESRAEALSESKSTKKKATGRKKTSKSKKTKAASAGQVELAIAPSNEQPLSHANGKREVSETSLDSELSGRIETLQLMLRKLHGEAAELLALVRSAKP